MESKILSHARLPAADLCPNSGLVSRLSLTYMARGKGQAATRGEEIKSLRTTAPGDGQQGKLGKAAHLSHTHVRLIAQRGMQPLGTHMHTRTPCAPCRVTIRTATARQPQTPAPHCPAKQGLLTCSYLGCTSPRAPQPALQRLASRRHLSCIGCRCKRAGH